MNYDGTVLGIAFALALIAAGLWGLKLQVRASRGHDLLATHYHQTLDTASTPVTLDNTQNISSTRTFLAVGQFVCGFLVFAGAGLLAAVVVDLVVKLS